VNIFERHVTPETGSADAWSYDEPNFSPLEFFIELQCVNDFVPWEILWQTRRQLKPLQKVDHCIALSGR
jgi:hypothetical protein